MGPQDIHLRQWVRQRTEEVEFERDVLLLDQRLSCSHNEFPTQT